MTQAYAKQRAGRARRAALHLGEGPGLRLTAPGRDLVVIIGKSFKPPARGVLAVKAQTSARAQPQGRSVPGRTVPGGNAGARGVLPVRGAAGAHRVFEQGGCSWQVESGNGAMPGLGRAGSLLPAAGQSGGGGRGSASQPGRGHGASGRGLGCVRAPGHYPQARRGDARVQRGGCSRGGVSWQRGLAMGPPPRREAPGVWEVRGV